MTGLGTYFSAGLVSVFVVWVGYLLVAPILYNLGLYSPPKENRSGYMTWRRAAIFFGEYLWTAIAVLGGIVALGFIAVTLGGVVL